MTYTKQSWVNNVTPVDDARMNHIEDGIFNSNPYYGATPPASPVDGDLWCLPADTTNGVMWLFRYRAASASAYKWEFVGGGSLTAGIAGDEVLTATAGAWSDATTVGPLVTVPRAGDYVAQGVASMYTTGGAATGLLLGIANGATTPAIISQANEAINAYALVLAVGPQPLLAVAASTDIRLRYVSGNNVGHALYRQLAVTPRRVS